MRAGSIALKGGADMGPHHIVGGLVALALAACLYLAWLCRKESR